MDPTRYLLCPWSGVITSTSQLASQWALWESRAAAGWESWVWDGTSPAPHTSWKANPSTSTTGMRRILSNNLPRMTQIASTGSGGSLQPVLSRWECRICNMGPQREKQHNDGKGKQKASAPFPLLQLVNVSNFHLFYSFQWAREITLSVPLCMPSIRVLDSTEPCRLLQKPEVTKQAGVMHVFRDSTFFFFVLRIVWYIVIPATRWRMLCQQKGVGERSFLGFACSSRGYRCAYWCL